MTTPSANTQGPNATQAQALLDDAPEPSTPRSRRTSTTGSWIAGGRQASNPAQTPPPASAHASPVPAQYAFPSSPRSLRSLREQQQRPAYPAAPASPKTQNGPALLRKSSEDLFTKLSAQAPSEPLASSSSEGAPLQRTHKRNESEHSAKIEELVEALGVVDAAKKNEQPPLHKDAASVAAAHQHGTAASAASPAAQQQQQQEKDAMPGAGDTKRAGAAGGAMAAPPADGPNGLRFRSESFWDPRLKMQRSIIFKGILPFVVLMTTVIVWGFVSIYWGSLYDIRTQNLKAMIINADGNGQIGQAISSALLDTTQPSSPYYSRRLGWYEASATEYPDYASIETAIAVDEVAWVAVQVMEGASEALQAARLAGNSSWNPAEVVQVYYSQARNYQATGSYVVQPVQEILSQAIAQLNVQLLGSFLANSGANAQAALLTAAERAPQTVAQPIGMTINNLRPFDQYVTVATTFVGLIYVLILAFNITMAGYGTRQPILPYLKLSHLAILRFVVPLFAYFWLSLSFAALNTPFRVHFTGLNGNDAAGFFAFFATLFTGMIVLGYITEVLISMVGPKFIGFGLVFIIIINVSVCSLPLEALSPFYRYGYAMPFYQMKESFLTIIFSTGKHINILKYFGILWAWLVVLLVTLPFWFWYEQHTAIKERKAAAARGGPGGPPGAGAPGAGRAAGAAATPASSDDHHNEKEKEALGRTSSASSRHSSSAPPTAHELGDMERRI